MVDSLKSQLIFHQSSIVNRQSSIPLYLTQWIIVSVVVCLLGFIFPMRALAKSPAGLVKEGNSAYNEGKYDKAISSYDEALKDAPESPYIYLNKGAALYKKGDYAGASEAFGKAALKSKDPLFEAKSKFNLGNSAYKQAEALKQKDLDKALEDCSNSIGDYQDALKLDPKLNEAAENMEMVRIDMKNILDQINKQKKAGRDEQEKKKETAKQLKEIVKDQESSLEKNQKLDAERRAKGDTSRTTKEIGDLSSEQKAIRDKTDALLKKLQKGDNKTDASKEDTAAKHLENATKEQDAASGNLDQRNTTASTDNQKKAVKELKDALDALNAKDKNGSGQDNESQQARQDENQNDKNEGQQQASSEGESRQDRGDQSRAMKTTDNSSDDARDILNDEKADKEQRRALAVRSYKEVDKDW
jgi:Ca-activated chloride channel homolog